MNPAKNILSTYREIVTHFIFIGAVFCTSIVYSLIILFNIIGPFVIQELLHFTPVAFGYIAFIMGFAFFFGNLSNRFMLQKKEPHHLISFGILLMLASTIVMLIFSAIVGINLYVLVIPTFVTLYASGFVFPNAMGKCLSLFPDKAGSASALLGSLMLFITGLMSILGSFLKTHSLIPYAITYLILQIIALAIYWLIFRKPIKVDS